jgi:hypothetical protein
MIHSLHCIVDCVWEENPSGSLSSRRSVELASNESLCWLVANPFHVLQEHLLAAAVVGLRCPAVGMPGDPLRHFKRSSILQEVRDSGSSQRMGRECIRQLQATISSLAERGRSQRRIASELRIDRETVCRYLRLANRPFRSPALSGKRIENQPFRSLASKQRRHSPNQPFRLPADLTFGKDFRRSA